MNTSLQETLKIRYKIIADADENSVIVYGNWLTDPIAARISAIDISAQFVLRI